MASPADQPGRDGKPPKSPWAYLNAGLQFGAIVGMGAALGWWLGQRYGWEPWATIVGSMLGVAAGTYQFLRTTL